MDSVLPMNDLNRNNINPISSPPCTIAATSIVPIIMEPKLEPLDDDLVQTNFQNPSMFYYNNFSYPNIASSSSFHFHPNPSSITPISPITSIPTPQNLPSFLDDSSNVYFQNAFADEGMDNYVNEDSTILEDPNNFNMMMDNYVNEDSTILEDPNNPNMIIVPVNSNGNNSQTQLSDDVLSRKYTPRSRELVRVTIFSPEDILYFRNVVRKTRMVYDSLRVFVSESEKFRSLVEANSQKKTRVRGDLKAAKLMKARGLWLNRGKRIVGSIPGVEIGDVYLFRMELCVIGLHEQTQAGIDYLPGSQSPINVMPIATSVIVSGGYEDDEDTGNVIIYTGQGGQDKHNRQIMNQKLEGGNLALEMSKDHGIEVRVIRGLKYEGSASGKVYVYDGLYRIVHSWFDVGKSGFGVFKYQLDRIENQPQMGSYTMRLAMTLRTRPLEVRPKGYVTFDLSMKKEKVPVFLFNDLDNNLQPTFYEYLVTAVFPQIAHQGRNGVGCDCVGGCLMNGCSCAISNGGVFAYDKNGILIRGKPVVLECGPHCKCPGTCRNRVSQRGVRNKLEVFRSGETGWAVRSLDLIQAGAFICEFSGVVLTREQVEICTMNGDNLVYPGRFAEKWKEWGDLSDISSDFVRPSFPSIPPLDFAIDVSRFRNVACYMSHSSSPNVLVQPVLYDHDNVSFPHLMLFAMENIPPLREITLDYGVDEWTQTGNLAICG